MADDEQRLAGGNISGVVRVGNRVHRSTDTWSSAVHELMRYLETRGFDGAPRFLGMDPQGREMLTFIDGEVGNDPVKSYMQSDEALAEMARLLRKLHDLTAEFPGLRELDNWQLVYPDRNRHEVICHNDAAPYNTVFSNGKPIALIDFDTAGPGPRIWDIAYTLYTFVPLSRFAPDGNGGLEPYESTKHAGKRAERIHLFCDAYGLEGREQLLGVIEERLNALCSLIETKAAEGVEAFRIMVEEGHTAHYRKEIEFHRKHGHEYFRDEIC